MSQPKLLTIRQIQTVDHVILYLKQSVRYQPLFSTLALDTMAGRNPLYFCGPEILGLSWKSQVFYVLYSGNKISTFPLLSTTYSITPFSSYRRKMKKNTGELLHSLHTHGKLHMQWIIYFYSFQGCCAYLSQTSTVENHTNYDCGMKSEMSKP